MISVGLGFKRGTCCSDMLSAIDAVLASRSLRRQDIDILATASFKKGSAGLNAAAENLGIAVRYFDSERLAAMNGRLATRSSHSLRHTGTECLCEAAALSALDDDGLLVCPRQIIGPVTCAIAEGLPS